MKRYCLRTVLCISIALSLLITSVHFPARHAEAFVAPVALATPMAVETIGALLSIAMIVYSSQKNDTVVRQACTRMFPAQNKGPHLCILPANPTFLAIQAQIFTYVAWACPDLKQTCLEKLNGKAKTLLNTIENSLRKNPMAFGAMCRVMLTLIGMTIPEYCAANGKGIPPISSGSSTPPKNPPKGRTANTTAGFGVIPPNFFSKLSAQLSTTVNALLKNCPAWLKKIVPLCQKSQASVTALSNTEYVKKLQRRANQLLNDPVSPQKNLKFFHAKTSQLLNIFGWIHSISNLTNELGPNSDVTNVINGTYESKPREKIYRFEMVNLIMGIKITKHKNANRYVQWIHNNYVTYEMMRIRDEVFTLLQVFKKQHEEYLKTSRKNYSTVSITQTINDILPLTADYVCYQHLSCNQGKPGDMDYKQFPTHLLGMFPEHKFREFAELFLENISWEEQDDTYPPVVWKYSPKKKK